ARKAQARHHAPEPERPGQSAVRSERKLPARPPHAGPDPRAAVTGRPAAAHEHHPAIHPRHRHDAAVDPGRHPALAVTTIRWSICRVMAREIVQRMRIPRQLYNQPAIFTGHDMTAPATFEVLAEPSRRRILDLLRD